MVKELGSINGTSKWAKILWYNETEEKFVDIQINVILFQPPTSTSNRRVKTAGWDNVTESILVGSILESLWKAVTLVTIYDLL